MKKIKKKVNVELTAYLELRNQQLKKIETMIKELNCEKYSLNVIGSYINENNEVEVYIIINTEGSYEENLGKLRHLHLKLEELLKNNSIKYNGMSLVPNKVEWN